MKKSLCIILSFMFTALLLPRSFAAEGIITESVSPPVIGSAEIINDGDNAALSIDFSADTAACEQVRQLYLERLLGSVPSDRLEQAGYGWILYETRIFCQITADGASAVIPLDPDCGSHAELSLTERILPAMSRDPGFYRLTGGFDAEVSLFISSENYSSSDVKVFVLSKSSETAAVSVPAFRYADAVLPEDAEANGPFFTLDTDHDFVLPVPSRRGCSFGGWLTNDGTYTEVIPRGQSRLHVESQWLPKTYSIHYYLTTDISFSFGRADNTANPTEYTYGEEVFFHSIKSPVGGYTFDGWYADRSFSGDSITSLNGITGDIILYAKWISDEDKEARDSERRESYAAGFGYGDVDGDGDITSSDARLVLRAAVGLERFDSDQAKKADVMGTGAISSGNARIILRVSVGLDSLYEVLTFYGVIPYL